ncbi:MAG TPA: hypothetical protein VFK13_02975 [Gemmatimonadaceae bacterium]|nr:hypothetical protein [Gemmatimonadaceae bacterium]
MYATCLFCNQPLGANEAIESFPVGRRLAFDAAKGRLWVVCRHCEKWNLSPLEERWEAIERAEQLYHDTRRRISTEHVGLAKMRDGTELVRIGQPLRPEFAAWRYGDQFGRRRRRQTVIAGAGVGALGAVVIGGAAAGVGIGGFAWALWRVAEMAIHGSGDAVIARVRGANGEVLRVRRRHLAQTQLLRGGDGALAINLRYAGGETRVEGDEAMRVAALVVPAANRFGGSRETVARAVERIENAGNVERYLDALTQSAHETTRPAIIKRRSDNWNSTIRKHGLFGLSSVDRLALEMALHEEAERRAAEGELDQLERAWREAEEIAAISDDLLLPRSVLDRITHWRSR